MKTILFFLMSAACCIGQTYDVLLYKDTPNPDGIPGNWPARVEISTGRPSPWFQVTKAQLETYKANNAAAYEQWEAQREADKLAAETAERTRRETLIAQAISDFQMALDNWANLTAAQQKAVLQRCVQVLIALLKDELKP
jgi:hypothetical protein